MLEKIFKLKENKTTVKTELMAGLTTFMTMAYILAVNPSILSAAGMDKSAVLMATALASFVGTALMALFANYPFALAPGMGLNAYLAYTIAGSAGFTWQQCMILLTISGILFFVFSLTPVRKIIIESIPKDLQLIISSALGAFICFVGLKNSGVIVQDGGTLVTLGSLLNPSTLIAIVSIILCFGMMFSKNKILSTLAIPLVFYLPLLRVLSFLPL